MNRILRKMLLPAAVLSFMFVVPAAAVEPSPSLPEAGPGVQTLPGEIAFQIPMNNYCSNENSLDFSFQLSNTSSEPADVTLRFYEQDGSEFTEEGTSYVEIGSDLIPGTAQTLAPHATGLYHINFGNHKKCSERIYLGKITANAGQVSLLAGGWVARRDGMQVIGTEPVTVHDNQVFELAAEQAPQE